MSDERRSRIAIAALGFAVVATLAYLAQRLVDHAQGDLVDPLSIVEEPHVAFYWRCAVAAWWGGLGAVLVHLWAARTARLPRAARIVGLVALPAGALHLILSWLFP